MHNCVHNDLGTYLLATLLYITSSYLGMVGVLWPEPYQELT